jgi:hypothetical protein
MSARVGVVEERSTNPVAAVISPMPIAMPSSAVSRGRPAAMSELNVMNRTIAATTRPMPSVALLLGRTCRTSPPTSTVRPWARA